jgi:hypothetical protein
MSDTRAEFERRRREHKGLPNWCESCGAVLCCGSCLLRHRDMCARAAWAYGMSDGEFEKAVRDA